MKWKYLEGVRGIRYREHLTRRYGAIPDRYFTICYQHQGERKEEGFGWLSEGRTLKKAMRRLDELKEAAKDPSFKNPDGTPKPTRLSEARKAEEERKEREAEAKARQEKENLTFSQFFKETYYPIAERSKKPESHLTELGHFKIWIEPAIGSIPFKDLRPIHLERLKKTLLDAGKSPRTIQYIFSTVRVVWNTARKHRLIEGDCPTKAVKKPRVDNRRLRFLSRDEANLLLNSLKERSQNLFEMAIISLHCGLRAGEIFKLIWADVDLERGILTLRDPKGRPGRAAFMTNEVKEIFKNLNRGNNQDYVFPDRKGNKVKEISNAFSRAVEEIGLNKDVKDPRYKVCFHSLRHTFASWLVENGTSLYTVKELLGHSTLAMTERYSHLGENTLQTAVLNLEKSLNNRAEGKMIYLDRHNSVDDKTGSSGFQA